MTDTEVASSTSAADLLAAGRRHLAVKDFSAAVETLATACELLAKEHGDTADQCAEAYLWYGKSLLGLSREESGVLGDGMPGANAEEGDDEDEEGDANEENGEAEATENGKADPAENGEAAPKENGVAEKSEAESTSKDDEPTSSKPETAEEPAASNGEDANDESVANLENEDDVENLQLAWEMLDLSRSILENRVQDGGGFAARALLADAHLALGEVALESETYDKAVADMQSCLELQKELYRGDDRRIAETHYQIGLANSLASNFEDAITHFKNAANILETRIQTLESPARASADDTVHQYSSADPGYSVQGEIDELKGLLPEIQEKIQDMMEYKAETIRRVRETLCPSNGAGSFNGAGPAAGASDNGGLSSSSASSSSAKPVTNISHLVKRKRKSSETEEASAAKKANT